MSIQTDQELKNTIAKLARLERHYEEAKKRPIENEYTRELSLRSLKQMINQFKEEIVRYRVHAKASHEKAGS